MLGEVLVGEIRDSDFDGLMMKASVLVVVG